MGMNRRKYIATIGATTSVLSLAGCSDLVDNGTTSTPESGRSIEPQERSATGTERALDPESRTPTQTGNTIQIDTGDAAEVTSVFTEYSYSHGIINATPRDMRQISSNTLRITLIFYEYPVEEVVSFAVSEPFESTNYDQRQRVNINLPDSLQFEFGHYAATIFPASAYDGESISEAATTEKLSETDRFRIVDAPTIEHSPDPLTENLQSETLDDYRRINAEGLYYISIDSTIGGEDFEFPYIVFKGPYAKRKNNDTERSYGYLHRNSADIAGAISTTARQDGYTTDDDLYQAAVSVVRNLPTPDSPGTIADGNTKYPVLTLAEGGGDSEDVSLMLASILSSQPYGYGMRIVEFDTGFGTAIRGSPDIDGVFWEDEGIPYYYLEPTESGYLMGELPEEYDQSTATLHNL
jgi:hypothetical protein